MSRNTFKMGLVAVLAAALMAVSGVGGLTYIRQHEEPTSLEATQSQRDEARAAIEAGAEKPSEAKESLETIYLRRLPGLQVALQRVIGHLEAGHSHLDVVEELRGVQVLVDDLQKAIGRHVKPEFVNSRCLIMGTPIDPANVPDEMTREFQGQKVAFCCGGCPAVWDELSDADKAAKLKEAIDKADEGDGTHTHR